MCNADVTPHCVLVDARRRDVLAPEEDPSAIDRLQQVHAAKQRGLARSRCSYETDDLVGRHRKVDSAQDLEVAE
jgi:hypothetical protein